MKSERIVGIPDKGSGNDCFRGFLLAARNSGEMRQPTQELVISPPHVSSPQASSMEDRFR